MSLYIEKKRDNSRGKEENDRMPAGGSSVCALKGSLARLLCIFAIATAGAFASSPQSRVWWKKKVPET
jgi:hypothetical protein